MVDSIDEAYEVRFENGSAHMVRAASFAQALEVARQCIANCFPSGFDINAMVRPTMIRKLGYCGLCGIPTTARATSSMHGWQCPICDECNKERLCSECQTNAKNVENVVH